MLVPHFEAEESDDYFGALIAERPRVVGRVNQLRDDHERLSEDLGILIELAEGALGYELGSRLERFLIAFELHERAENALLQEVCFRDDGESGA